MSKARPLAVFGAVDGLTLVIGLVLGLAVSRQPGAALWHAALAGGAGELVGMSSGQYLSDKESGWWPALACGVASAAACLAPGVPFAVPGLSRWLAVTAACAVAVAVAAGIAWLRPERGAAAVTRTFGILAAAGTLAAATGFI
jgi:hypothetical protein